jgi:hypothetical protein
MRTSRSVLTGALAAAALLGLSGAAAAQQGQGVPQVTDMPHTGDAPVVLQPQPDLHGRSSAGTGEQHGNDDVSPGGGATGVTTGTAAAAAGGGSPDDGTDTNDAGGADASSNQAPEGGQAACEQQPGAQRQAGCQAAPGTQGQ